MQLPRQGQLLGLMANHRRHLKFLQSLHESEPPPSLKIKSLIKAHVLGHLRRAIGSLTSTKSMFMQLVNNKSSSKKKKKTTKTKKRLLSFLKLHLHLSSSHVAPVQELPGSKRSDADPKWRFASFSTDQATIGGAEAKPSSLAGYLDWLERSSEPPPPEGGVDDDDGRSEIDRLADKFIASCHERFRLEKQESYRRYQEMLARSM